MANDSCCSRTHPCDRLTVIFRLCSVSVGLPRVHTEVIIFTNSSLRSWEFLEVFLLLRCCLWLLMMAVSSAVTLVALCSLHSDLHSAFLNSTATVGDSFSVKIWLQIRKELFPGHSWSQNPSCVCSFEEALSHTWPHARST